MFTLFKYDAYVWMPNQKTIPSKSENNEVLHFAESLISLVHLNPVETNETSLQLFLILLILVD